MKSTKASAIVYTRLKHIGFPGGYFRVCPEGMSADAEKQLLEYAHSAMENAAELRSKHQLSRVVICRDGYVVLGAAGFLRDLASDGWEGTDEAGRLIHGFVGYVWKQEEFSPDVAFPTAAQLDVVIRDWIRPRWEDSRNSPWAAGHIPAPFRYQLSAGDRTGEGYAPQAPIVPQEQEIPLLRWAMDQAAEGKNLSVCTNVTIYHVDSFRSPYTYVATCSRTTAAAPRKTEDAPAKPPVKQPAEPREVSKAPVQQRLPDFLKPEDSAPEAPKAAHWIQWILLGIALVLVLLLTRRLVRKLLVLICAVAAVVLFFAGRKKPKDVTPSYPWEPEKKQAIPHAPKPEKKQDAPPAPKPVKKQEPKNPKDPFDF